MKNFIRKTKKVLKNPLLIRQRLAGAGVIYQDDEEYLLRQFKELMGYEIDLSNPQTYTEKVNWLKLYDRNPIYNIMADKCEAKKYIQKVLGGDEYIIPTYGIYNSFDEIDFQKLPEQFVIKCTHDCGSIIVVEDKSKFDKEKAHKFYKRALKKSTYYYSREWVYKDIVPRIIVEKYIKDTETDELRDYKFYCFNGQIKALLVATNRQSKTCELNFDYFDAEFNHLPLVNHWHANAAITPQKPYNFEKMIELARVLSKGLPHVRVDFYEADKKIYFGEFTFYDMGGFLKIHPDEWDYEWGKMIDLSLAYNYSEAKLK